MAKIQFSLPHTLDLPAALDFSLTSSQIEEGEEFVFDFSKTKRVEPFPMLLVSSEINRLVNRFPHAKKSCENFQNMTYAGHMGFFKAFGFDFGKRPGEAKGGPRYLPMTIYDCAELKKSAAEKGIEVGDEVEEKSKHMTMMLCGTDTGAVFDTLSYSVRELVRNVIEHSKATQFGICAQYWPHQNKVEVTIVDRGIGLKESLTNNPYLNASDDKNAINYALMPAVSGKAFKGSPIRQRGHWANSGFGLYMTTRICRNGGEFLHSNWQDRDASYKEGRSKTLFPMPLSRHRNSNGNSHKSDI